MMRAHNRNRRLSNAKTAALLEHLESRQLLAADFAVTWNTAAFHLPAVLVPGDRFNPAGGTNRIEAPIRIDNLGTQAASGNVRVDFYLSADASFDPSQDTLIKTYTGQPFSIGAGGGAAFSPDMKLPATLAPGTYHLIARITPSASVGDVDTSNNIAVSANVIDVQRKFGDFAGRTGVAMTLRDSDGTLVTFVQTGGGSGTVAVVASGFAVTLDNSTDTTQVQVTAAGGDNRFDFASVAINGSVGAFRAAQGRLAGPLTATTGFGAMIFGDVVGHQIITVPASSRTPSFTFGSVNELSLVSAVGIDSIVVGNWIDRDGTPDAIRAPWIKTLTSSGNFYPSIFLSGGTYPSNGNTYTLGTVNIEGVVKAGSWAVTGAGGTVSVFATAATWSSTFRDGLGQMTVTNSLRGVLSARYLSQIFVGKDLLLGKTLAGAYLGQDGRLGGVGLNADQFTDGSIGILHVGRNVAGNFVGAGVDPVDGIFNNGNDAIIGGNMRSVISRIEVGHIAGRLVRFIANEYPAPLRFPGSPTPPPAFSIGGVAVDPATDARFAFHTLGPAATLDSFTTADLSGSMIATIRIHLTSRGLLDLESITDGSLLLTGPGGFSAPAFVSSTSWDGNGQYEGDNGFAIFTVRLNNVGQMPLAGTYTLSLVPDMIADMRGNRTQGMVVGSVTI